MAFQLISLLLVAAIMKNSLCASIGEEPAEMRDHPDGKQLFELGDLINSMTGMDIKNVQVDHFVNQGTQTIKKVSQSYGGGHSVVKTEITQISNTNPGGFRFERSLADKLSGIRDSVEDKMGLAHEMHKKVAGMVATGVNLVHSGKHKVEEFLNN